MEVITEQRTVLKCVRLTKEEFEALNIHMHIKGKPTHIALDDKDGVHHFLPVEILD